jgi:PHD/YefM family antitoxin component YafN of YafNO toxin-antitoxin module
MKLDMSTRPHVFIASTSKQRDLAHELAQRIELQGGEPGLVEETIEAGQDWQTAIKSQVERSQAAVVVVSPDSYESSRVREEWSQIQERIWEDPDFKVVPVIVEDAELPPFLKKWQGVSAAELDTDAIASAVKEIVATEENVRPLSESEQEDVKERYRSIARQAEHEIDEFQSEKPEDR